MARLTAFVGLVAAPTVDCDRKSDAGSFDRRVIEMASRHPIEAP